MKKLLVVLLALVMVFGLATSAFAYTDTKDLGTASQDAITKLSALDVLGGYPDGTFGPALSITRAEFAKIAVNIAGIGDAADNLGGVASQFGDVKTGAWYTGYVNLAASQGFIKGYENGTFRPNNNITMQEVVTVLLRIAGYDDNLPGPWPFDYIAKASSLGVTDDVAFTATAKANREAVAVMAANTLDQVMKYWDADKAVFADLYPQTAPLTAKTVLEQNFANGVLSNALVSGWGLNNKDELTLSVPTGGTKAFAEKSYISDGFTANALPGLYADVYYDKAVGKSDAKIVYIDVKSTTAFSDKAQYTYAGGVVTALKLDGKAEEVITAGAAVNNISASATTNQQVKIFYNKDGEVYRVDNLSNKTATGLIVVDKYDATAQRVVALYGTSVATKDKDVVVFKGGQRAALADLANGDIFYRNEGVSGIDEVISVINPKEATLTKATGTKLTIGDSAVIWTGASYTTDAYKNVNTIANVTDIDDAFNQAVKYVTLNGNPFKLAILNYTPVEDTSKVYGVVVARTGDGFAGGDVQAISILTADGKTTKYDFVKSTGYALPAAANVANGDFVEAKVSADGKIETKNIQVIGTAGTYAPSGASYIDQWASADTAFLRNGSRLKLAGQFYSITDSTVAFETKRTSGFSGNFDKATVVSVDTLKGLSTTAANKQYIAKINDNNEIVAILFNNSAITSSAKFGVLTGARYDGSDWYITVVGDKEYKAAANYGALAENGLYKFAISSDELTVENIASPGTIGTEDAIFARNGVDSVATAALSTENWVQSPAGGVATTAVTAGVVVTGKGGSSLTLGTGNNNYFVNADTKIYVVESDYDVVEADLGAISVGQMVVAMTTDKPSECILSQVFLLENTSVAASGAWTTGTATIADAASSTYTVTAPAGATISFTNTTGAAPAVGTDYTFTVSGNTVTIENLTGAAAGTVTFTYTVSLSGFVTHTSAPISVTLSA